VTGAAVPVIVDAGGLPAAGGRRVRTGLVFRVRGGITRPEDLHQLDAAGLRLVIDLRGEGEPRSVVERWCTERGMRYERRPIDAASQAHIAEMARRSGTVAEAEAHQREIYRAIVDRHGRTFAATIELLAGDLPAGFGCAAGKDRTGLAAAMLHVLLGVSEREAARSYAALAPSVEQLRPLAEKYLGLGPDEPLSEAARVHFGAPEQLMLDTFEHLRARHGGVEPYLRAAGLSDEAVDALRRELVEPAANAA